MKLDIKKEAGFLLLTVVAGVISALGLWVFVFPYDFVPSGVDGIAVSLQELTKLNAGYFNLIINITLLIIAWFFINKRYVIYTAFFTVTSSLMCIAFEEMHFYQYTHPTNAMVSALFAGILGGVSIGLMLRQKASSGGLDIVAAIIQKKKGHIRIERIVSFLSYIIVASSIFIYKDLNCILLSAIQIFSTEITIKALLKDTRNAIEVKIVTDETDSIRDDILITLNHAATVLDGKGLYSGESKKFLIVVISIRQLSDLLKILKKYPDAFVYYSDVMGVHGHFDR